MEMQSGFDELLETMWFRGKSLADELQEETNAYFLATGCYSLDVTLFNQEEDPWMNGYYNYDERLQHLGHNDYKVLDNRSNDCQVLQMDSQSELSSILTKLEEAGEIELLQRSIRQSKLDEKKAEESTKRLMAELEDQQKKSREAEIEINNLRRQLELLQAGSFIQALPTTKCTKTTITNELSFRHVDGSKDTIDSINAEEGVAVEVVVACCAVDPEEDVRQYKVVPVSNNFRSSSSLEHSDELFQMNSTGPDGVVVNYAIGESEVSLVNVRVRQTIRLGDEEVDGSTSTKIEWTVYGGSSSLKSPKSNQIESAIINLSNKSVELEETQQNIKQINLNPLKKPESHEICTFKSDSSSKPFQTYDAKQNEAYMHFNPNSDRSALIFHTGRCQLSGTGSYWWQIMRIKHALDPGIGHYRISFPNAQPMIRMNSLDDFVSSGEILSLQESDKNFVIEI